MNIFTATSLHKVMGAGLLLAISFFSASRASAQQVGYVLEMHGQWFLSADSQRNLAKSQALPARGVINARSPAQMDRIVIVNLKGDIIARRDCSNSGDCDRPINLPQAPAPDSSSWGVIVSSVMSLLGGEPDRYSIHRKRDEELPDAVVQIKRGQLDLVPVFEKKGKGRYYLRLRAIPRGGKAPIGKWAGPVTLDWDPAKPSTVAVANLEPGLYELALLEREGDDYLPAGVSVWILVSKPDEYSKTASSYQEAVALTRKWGSDVTPEGVRSFLRAHLDRLAAQARN